MAASGWRSWLLMLISASTAVPGDSWSSKWRMVDTLEI